MHPCPTGHPALPALFDPTVPNHPVLWAVLQGRNGGSAVVDDVRNPSQCLLRTDALLTFSSRQISPTFLREAIAHFRQAGPVWLVQSSSAPPDLPEPAHIIERLEFYDVDARSPLLADLRRRLPDRFEIRPLDRPLLERCEWREDIEFFCGSLDNFLAHGIGLCLMQGSGILVEAYATSLGGGSAEIGAVTREAYRGRGYAPIACAYLIDACEQRGYRAYWSCDRQNEASVRVAHKLGFRQEGIYHILEYE